MNDLILLPRLGRLRDSSLRLTNSASQALEKVVLADPGKCQVREAQHQQRDLERSTDLGQLHKFT